MDSGAPEVAGVRAFEGGARRLDAPGELAHAGYAIKLTHAGLGPPFHYRGRLVPPCTPGTITLVEPDEPMRAAPSLRITSFQGLVVERALMQRAHDARGGRGAPVFRAVHLRDPGLFRRLVAVHAALRHRADSLMQEGLISEALLDVLAAYDPRTDRSERREPRFVRRARELLEAQLERNLSLAELERALGVDRFYLLRSFRAFTGLPPHAYRTHQRVARARTLIAEGRALAEVALAVGYCDQSQLNRHFRKVVGMPAGAYARAFGARTPETSAGA